MAGSLRGRHSVDRARGLELFRKKFEAQGGYSTDSAIKKYHELVSQQEIIVPTGQSRKLPLLAPLTIALAQQFMLGSVIAFGFCAFLITKALLQGGKLGLFELVLLGLGFVIAVILLWGGAARAGRALQLARQGHMAWAVITNTSRKHHSAGMNMKGRRRSSTWIVNFAYAVDGHMYFCADEVLSKAGIDSIMELVLYDPNDPDFAQVADTVQGGCTFRPDGTLGYSATQGLVRLTLDICIIVSGMMSAWGWVSYINPQG